VDEEERAELEEAHRAFGQDLWRAIYVFSGGAREIAEDAVAEAFVRAGSRVGPSESSGPGSTASPSGLPPESCGRAGERWLSRPPGRIHRGPWKGSETCWRC
jgi:hypothetical protein